MRNKTKVMDRFHASRKAQQVEVDKVNLNATLVTRLSAINRSRPSEGKIPL